MTLPPSSPLLKPTYSSPVTSVVAPSPDSPPTPPSKSPTMKPTPAGTASLGIPGAINTQLKLFQEMSAALEGHWGSLRIGDVEKTPQETKIEKEIETLNSLVQTVGTDFETLVTDPDVVFNEDEKREIREKIRGITTLNGEAARSFTPGHYIELTQVVQNLTSRLNTIAREKLPKNIGEVQAAIGKGVPAGISDDAPEVTEETPPAVPPKQEPLTSSSEKYSTFNKFRNIFSRGSTESESTPRDPVKKPFQSVGSRIFNWGGKVTPSSQKGPKALPLPPSSPPETSQKGPKALPLPSSSPPETSLEESEALPLPPSSPPKMKKHVRFSVDDKKDSLRDLESFEDLDTTSSGNLEILEKDTDVESLDLDDVTLDDAENLSDSALASFRNKMGDALSDTTVDDDTPSVGWHERETPPSLPAPNTSSESSWSGTDVQNPLVQELGQKSAAAEQETTNKLAELQHLTDMNFLADAIGAAKIALMELKKFLDFLLSL